jgi:ribosome biogenesis GTPase
VRGNWERYFDYLNLLMEVQNLSQIREQSKDPEAVLKRKFKGDGSVSYEPRLAQKKYRQTSRRSQRQSLTGLDPLDPLE